MNFQDAEKTYKDLKAQHEAGKLSDSTFEAEVGKLRMQDGQGRWWQIGVQTGEWYMHDGQKWNKAKPPVTPPPSEPAPSPEITAVLPRPGATPKGAATAKAETAPKKNGGSALPARLFSSKPAGRNGGGGLSRNALIAIIAVVAVLCIAVALIGYSVVQSQVKGNIIAGLSGTATPTRGLVLPTVPLPPTLSPQPTSTPLPPPTPVVTATIPLLPALTSTRAAAAAHATATKTAAAAPKATATPNVAPGVYVLKLETDPARIDIGDATTRPQVEFKMTLLNSTGGMQTFYRWFVGVYQCPEQCSGDSAYTHTWGVTGKSDVNVGTGTVEVTTISPVSFGPGRCDYVAMPYYYPDPNTNNPLPFLKTNGQPMYYSFKVCQ